MTWTLARFPKIELHLHLEGCLTPAEAFRLAGRRVPGWSRADIAALYTHADFGAFLSHFGQILNLFREPEDLVWLLGRVLRRLKSQGVIYAEIRVSPTVWERHGLPPDECLRDLLTLRRASPVPFNLIVDAVRHWDVRLIERDMELACKYRGGGVVALGLGGDEREAPAARFGSLAEECRSRRLPLVPHAGEISGPEEVASAMDILGPARIGHGIASALSPQVLDTVVRRGVHLEVCPTSNRRTGAVGRGRRHPLGHLWRAGASLSVSTDDPAMFGTSLCGELRSAKASAGWTLADMGRSQRMAARAAFLPSGEKGDLLRRVCSAWPGQSS